MNKNTVRLNAVFVGSLLLFMIQPMLGRTLLPAFGGSAAVWTVCLASYQTLLLAGYLYAHYLAKIPFALQRRAHQALLAVAVIWSVAVAFALPTLQAFAGRGGSPALSVLFCVLLFIGLPYVLLAAGSTLIQSWLGQTGGGQGRSVYKLYAVSNLGSFCGLFIYPFLMEPFVGLRLQWWIFGLCMALYLALMFLFLNEMTPPGSRGAKEDISAGSSDSTATGGTWLWFLIPAVSVFTLNAVTTHLTLDVMPMPLLWVVLLGLFLLSYVLGFSDLAERKLQLLFVLAMIFLGAAGFFSGISVSKGQFKYALISCLGLVLFGALFLHSWLYSIRPHTKKLTVYYLGNALGGAVGGVTASLVAPLVFDKVLEFPVALFAVAGLAAFFVISNIKVALPRNGMLAVWLCATALVITGLIRTGDDREVVARKRGFFGTLQVLRTEARSSAAQGYVHEYVHGSTVHGIQVRIPGKERTPTTYFTKDGGGYAVLGHPKYRKGEPMRVNILGMGVGVMLSYARTNDYYRCYEISPEAVAIATDPALFTFVSGCPAELSIACEDARKGLERELAEGVEPYDVIQIDAFSGDNLPYHLSTKEAFELYFKMLKPDGILAVNISNWHLNLEPFIKAVGDEFNVPVLVTRCDQDFASLQFSATFAYFCRDPSGMGPPPSGAYLKDMRRVVACRLPRDGKGSFINLIRW